MDTTQLKAARDKFVAAGIGTYLPAVRNLLSAIDDHIAEDQTVPHQNGGVVEHAEALQTKVAELETQVALIMASATGAQENTGTDR